jgi:hypothetical protein
MEYFIHWAGFIGAWLLVAGPLVQAAIELRDEGLDEEAFHSVSNEVPEPDPISNWWWLLPPVAYVKNRRRSQAHREAWMRAMTPDQRAKAVGFSNKATGWFYVAGGAFLIFMKEAWELNELYHLPTFVYWIVVVVLAIVALANTVSRLQRSDQIIHVDEPDYQERMRAEKRVAMDARRAQRKPVK